MLAKLQLCYEWHFFYTRIINIETKTSRNTEASWLATSTSLTSDIKKNISLNVSYCVNTWRFTILGKSSLHSPFLFIAPSGDHFLQHMLIYSISKVWPNATTVIMESRIKSAKIMWNSSMRNNLCCLNFINMVGFFSDAELKMRFDWTQTIGSNDLWFDVSSVHHTTFAPPLPIYYLMYEIWRKTQPLFIFCHIASH